MAADNWGSLPSVIIVEILSYLSISDRLNAISTCKRWRDCLWHPVLWVKLNLKVNTVADTRRSKHLAENCGRFIREINVEFNSRKQWNVKECASILEILSQNRNLQVLSLKPSNCHIEWPERNTQNIVELFHGSIEQCIKTSRRLKHLSFGCLEELLVDTDYLLDLLASHQAQSLQSLHIASIKEDPDSYSLCDTKYGNFEALKNLKYLSIDYDYLTNELLECFIENHHVGLESLTINVHGIEQTRLNQKITRQTWWRITRYSPKLRVTLNLIHSFDGVHHLLDILNPCMPLAHFRMFFCSYVNIAAIDFIAQRNSSTLESIHIIDGFARGQPNGYNVHGDENPFVMLAWKCPLLQKLTLIGYEISDDDLIAIARLRGHKLQTFEIAENCVSTYYEEDDDNMWFEYGNVSQHTCDEISISLGREWNPLPDSKLHPAVKDSHADADTAYMDILLQDQNFC